MFSSNIKKIMKEKKLTIRQLESETGMSTRTLNKARSNDGISECPPLNACPYRGRARGRREGNL